MADDTKKDPLQKWEDTVNEQARKEQDKQDEARKD